MTNGKTGTIGVAEAHLLPIGFWSGSAPDGMVNDRFTGSVSTADGETLYVSTNWGALFSSQDAGLSWQEIENPTNFVGAVTVVPEIDVVLIVRREVTSTQWSGVKGGFLSQDKGKTWKPLFHHNAGVTSGDVATAEASLINVTPGGGIVLGVYGTNEPLVMATYYSSVWGEKDLKWYEDWRIEDWQDRWDTNTIVAADKTKSQKDQQLTAYTSFRNPDDDIDHCYVIADTFDKGILCRTVPVKTSHWSSNQYGQEMGQVTALQSNVDGSSMFAANDLREIYHSTNGGKTWELFEDSLRDREPPDVLIRTLTMSEDGSLDMIGLISGVRAAFYKWSKTPVSTSMQRLFEQVQKLKGDISALKKQSAAALAQCKQDMQATIDALQAKLDTANVDLTNARLAQTAALLEAHKQAKRVLDKALSDASHHLTETIKDIRTANTRVEAEHRKEFDEQLETASRHLTQTLKDQRKLLKDSLDKAHKEASQNLEKSLKEARKTAQTRLDRALDAAKADAKSDLDAALKHAASEALIEKIKAVNVAKADAEADIVAEVKRGEALTKRALDAAAAQAKVDLKAALDKQSGVFSKERSTLERQITDAQDHTKDVQNELKDEQKKSSGLQSNLNNANAEIDTLNDELSGEQKKSARLTASLQSETELANWRHDQLTQVADGDLLNLLPMGTLDPTMLLDYSTNTDVNLTRRMGQLNLGPALLSVPLDIDGLAHGFTFMADIRITSSNPKTSLVNLIFSGGAGSAEKTISLGVESLSDQEVFFKLGDDSLHVVSQPNTIKKDVWCPWVFTFEPGRTDGDVQYARPEFQTDHGPVAVKDVAQTGARLGPIDFKISLPDPLDSFTFELRDPHNSQADFEIRDVRVFKRVLSPRVIDAFAKKKRDRS